MSPAASSSGKPSMSAAREEVLDRVRRALGESRPNIEIPRAYRTRGDLTDVQRLDLLADRLRDYQAQVQHASRAELAGVVAACLTERGIRTIVVPPELEITLPGDVDVTVDQPLLSAGELDRIDGVVTRCAVAIAETGTIVLDGSPNQGRRMITLVPDYHLCVVESAQVVATVPEAIARLHPSHPQTWISGPSATSDIELSRVEGVHGPRSLEVILVTGP